MCERTRIYLETGEDGEVSPPVYSLAITAEEDAEGSQLSPIGLREM